MPVKAENLERYPVDWRAISRRIRFERANGRCECRGECSAPQPHRLADARCANVHGGRSVFNGVLVVLTTAHLNHIPEDVREENLLALCAQCHLAYDRDLHLANRAATMTARREQRAAQRASRRRAA